MKAHTRRSKEYELYVPLHFNDGRPVPTARLKSLKKLLMEHFGGLTQFRHKQEGAWKIGTVVFRDQIVILRVISDQTPHEVERFWKKTTGMMKREWQQQDVLLVMKDVRLI